MVKVPVNGFAIPDYEDEADIPALIQQNVDAAESIIETASEERKDLGVRIDTESETRVSADTALGARIDGKADAKHTHTVSEITDSHVVPSLSASGFICSTSPASVA